jgi:hypothetical protein
VTRRRTVRVVAIVAIAVLAVGVVGYGLLTSGPADDGPPPLAARVHPLLPDLSVAPFNIVTGSLSDEGRKSLRFGVTIINVGEGDFLLRARRSNFLASDWSVTQRIEEQGGGYTEKLSSATLVYGGDGHDHWHIPEVESHRLETPDGKVLGEVVKNGFCFFDTNVVTPSVAGAPSNPVYEPRDCGKPLDSHVRMGLSVGWGDEYPWHLFQQEIDITNVPPGRYRLTATADPFGWFDELDESNNVVWSDIDLFEEDGVPAVRILDSSQP